MHEEALRAVRMRHEMVSVVSHDLRGPLSVISMAGAMLAEPGAEPPSSDVRMRYVDMIFRSAEQSTTGFPGFGGAVGI